MLNNINLTGDADTFEPGMFSLPELHFLLEHMEEPPIVAFAGDLPKHMVRARAEIALTRFNELDLLATHKGIPWAGFDAIKDSIVRFLAWDDRSKEIARRTKGRIQHPSMFHWDDTGRPHKYAIGADSGEMVRNEILDDGTRKPFGVKLSLKPEDALSADLTDVAPWLAGKSMHSKTIQADKLVMSAKGRMAKIECSVCGKAEEYDASSRNSLATARARMGRHLKTAKQEVNRHRILYTKEFR